MFVALTAFMPAVFVPISVVLVVVIAFVVARTRHHAGRGKGDQPEKYSASQKALYICHGCSRD
jgi:hypothetical protein